MFKQDFRAILAEAYARNLKLRIKYKTDSEPLVGQLANNDIDGAEIFFTPNGADAPRVLFYDRMEDVATIDPA